MHSDNDEESPPRKIRCIEDKNGKPQTFLLRRKSLPELIQLLAVDTRSYRLDRPVLKQTFVKFASVPKLTGRSQPNIGNDGGAWLCIPKLAGKRVDVKVGHKTGGRISGAQKKSEGQWGYIEMEKALTSIDLKPKNTLVVRLGEFGTRLFIEPMFLQPMRTTIHPPQVVSDICISQLDGRVVIIGPDITGDQTWLGEYGKTCVGGTAMGAGYINVRFPREKRDAPVVIKTFHVVSLCRSYNVDGVFTTATQFL